jgi:hypothetical protein
MCNDFETWGTKCGLVVVYEAMVMRSYRQQTAEDAILKSDKYLV